VPEVAAAGDATAAGDSFNAARPAVRLLGDSPGGGGRAPPGRGGDRSAA
jgi:hypothetical protein